MFYKGKYSNIKDINKCVQYMSVKQVAYTQIDFMNSYIEGKNYTDLELPLTMLLYFKHSLY